MIKNIISERGNSFAPYITYLQNRKSLKFPFKPNVSKSVQGTNLVQI